MKLLNEFKKRKILYTILIIVVLLFLAIFIYLNIYYHADKEVYDYLKNTEEVKVTKISDGYFFDGYGENDAIIFYPGAKVETESYATLMYKIAKEGIDCFLINMPFRIAFFGSNKASDIIKEYKYDNYIMMGHSLGGVVATSYLNKHEDKVNTIIYLASYPNEKLNENTKMLSIYGSEDKVLSKKAYENSKDNWSSIAVEFKIEGGNHANFANYGNQKGDGTSTIDRETQQNLTVSKIVEFIRKEEAINEE